MSNGYHFHKDCKYYPQCTEKVEKEGKHKYIRFTCPALKQTLKYYLSDVHTIKINCSKFEPYQQSLMELLKGAVKHESNTMQR